jgi:PAS domain S-box-containing protein
MTWTKLISRRVIILILFAALIVMNIVSAVMVLSLYPGRGGLLPILAAALVSDWKGILATGLFLLAAMIAQNGLPAILAAPVSPLVFCFCAFLVILLWLSLDMARKEAVAKAGELEKNASKLRFQSELIERAGQSIIAGDKDGRILFWNEAATRLHGWTAAEMIGKNDVERLIVMGNEERTRTQAEFRAGRSYSLDSVSARKDGSRFPSIINVSPLFDEAGAVSGWVIVGVDITELRKAEEEVLRLNSSLEAKVEERTAQLSEANASLSRALAELKATEAKLVLAGKMSSLGQLAAGIAHEVNTPLGADHRGGCRAGLPGHQGPPPLRAPGLHGRARGIRHPRRARDRAPPLPEQDEGRGGDRARLRRRFRRAGPAERAQPGLDQPHR